MYFSKILKPVAPKLPKEIMLEDRQLSPAVNGGFDVCFVQVPSSEVCKETLDPRVVTLQYCIENNVFIEPTDVQKIFNITDPSDLESIAGRVSENAYKYIMDNEPNFNFDKNTIVESSKSE